MNKLISGLFHIARAAAAIIMLQTLFFKFTAHPQSVELFSTIGMEPAGRIIIGIVELIASLLLFFPRFIWLGALLGLGLMIGAVYFHLAFLGIDELFAMALVVFVACCYILYHKRKDIPCLWNKTKCLT